MWSQKHWNYFWKFFHNYLYNYLLLSTDAILLTHLLPLRASSSIKWRCKFAPLSSLQILSIPIARTWQRNFQSLCSVWMYVSALPQITPNVKHNACNTDIRKPNPGDAHDLILICAILKSLGFETLAEAMQNNSTD